MGGGTEEELQPPGVQARRGGIGGDIGHAVAFAGNAGGRRCRGVERAGDGDDLLLGDQALGLGTRFLRIALMIGKHQLDPGVAEPGEAGILRRRKIEVMGVVDDVDGGFQRMLGVCADLGAGTGERPDRADRDLPAGLGERARPEQGQCGAGQQDLTTIHRRDS